MKYAAWVVVAMLVLASAGGGWAQENQGVLLAKGLRLLGEYRLRYEARNAASFFAGDGDSPKDESSRLRLGLLWEGPDKSRIFIEPQWAYQNTHGGPGPTSMMLRDVDVLEGYASMVDHGRLCRSCRVGVCLCCRGGIHVPRA